MQKAISFKNKMQTDDIMRVEMNDGKEYKLVAPTKYLFDVMVEFQDQLNKNELDDLEKLEKIYVMAKEILSANTEHEDVDLIYVKKNLSDKEIIFLLQAYKAFVEELAKAPKYQYLSTP